jgi:hypothetical protein
MYSMNARGNCIVKERAILDARYELVYILGFGSVKAGERFTGRAASRDGPARR